MNALEIKRYALKTKIRYPLPLIVKKYREIAEEVCIHRNHIWQATAVTNAITRHPSVLANSWATLDEISGGRAVMACSGPKSLHLGGRVADGVLFQVGADPAFVRYALDNIRIGAEQAGRNLDDVELYMGVHNFVWPANMPDAIHFLDEFAEKVIPNVNTEEPVHVAPCQYARVH